MSQPESSILKQYWKRIQFPSFLLFLIIISFGLQSFQQGFYLDDWYIILFKEKFGSSGFMLYFSQDRPLESYPYIFIMSLMNDSPVLWAMFALFMRWILVLTFWKTVNRLFPKLEKLWLWATVLFAVYPGFKFHWFSIMFSIFYGFFVFVLLSYLFMSHAIENRNKPQSYASWTLLGVLFLALGIFPQEYFFGLEIIRPIVLWAIHARNHPKKWKQVHKFVLLDWIPYLLVLISFAVYRYSQRDTFAYKIGLLDKLTSHPLTTLKELAFQSVISVYQGLVVAWKLAYINLSEVFASSSTLADQLTWLLLFGFFFVSLGLYWFTKRTKKDNVDRWRVVWLLPVGLLMCFLSLIPFYAGGFNVGTSWPWNRFLLAMMPGIVVFLVGLLETLVPWNFIKIIIIAFLCTISMGSHFLVSNEFISYWETQKQLFWQLSWRVPEIKKGTTLVTAGLPIAKYYSGPTLTGAVNLIYGSDNKNEEIDYYVALMDSNQADSMPELGNGEPIIYSLRGLKFLGNSNEVLAFYMPPNGCVQILSNGIVPFSALGTENEAIITQLSLSSNLENIILEPPQPVQLPAKYFGIEDTKQWCFFYQKAALALQRQEWQDVIDIYSEAESQQFVPNNLDEYLPKVEAWFMLGDSEKALAMWDGLEKQFSEEIQNSCPYVQKLHGTKNIPLVSRNVLEDISLELKCGN